jgi:hypothetical protein
VALNIGEEIRNIARALNDYHLQVVSLEGLRKMKRLAGRPQDLVDLERLAQEE